MLVSLLSNFGFVVNLGMFMLMILFSGTILLHQLYSFQGLILVILSFGDQSLRKHGPRLLVVMRLMSEILMILPLELEHFLESQL